MLTRNGKMVCHLNNENYRCDGSGYYLVWIATDNQEVRTGGMAGVLGSLTLSVGTGSNAPASTDLDITNKNAGLTVVTRTATTGTINPSYTMDYIGIFTVTYRNDTENDITVCESGLMAEASGSANKTLLIARDVFEPVTIAPGESYTFSMYIG